MKFKNTKPSIQKKSVTKSAAKPNLKEEEIKEIVTETVEEVLKEQSEKKESPATDEIKSETPVEHHEDSEDASQESIESHTEETKEMPEVSSGGDEKNPETSPNPTIPQPTTSEIDQPKSSPDVVTSTPVVASTAPTPQEADSGFSAMPEAPTKKFPFLRLIVIVIILILLGVGGYWYFKSPALKSMVKLPAFISTLKPSPTPAPTTVPTPTTAQVDVSQYAVTVLNGSGVSGAAASAKALLTTAGFTVGSTGNASSSDFVQTVISAKESVNPAVIEKLIKVLSDKYTVSTHPVTLSDTESADIVVTLGSGTK